LRISCTSSKPIPPGRRRGKISGPWSR
jgi:hypothetical protein